MENIRLRGVRTHNLKNIDVDIPRGELTVITGLSGSGKSSLAFDTIYAEGQRRYVESLSSYARQFLSVMNKPEFDLIEGLSPAISIEQKSTSHNPRSTVGTVTEIYDYLRLLFSRIGEPRCPDHGTVLKAQSVSEMVDRILSLNLGSKWMLLAPVVRDKKGEHHQLFVKLRSLGFARVVVDGEVFVLDDPPKLALRKKHNIDVVVDRFSVREGIELRLAESLETALDLGEGVVGVKSVDGGVDDLVFSSLFACPTCGYSLTDLEPRLFSFNNPSGACANCDGLGFLHYFDEDLVVQNSELSLASGAIRGWDRGNSYYFLLIESLAKHYKFSVDTSFNELDSAIKEMILFGSGTEEIKFSYRGANGKKYSKSHSFEGVMPSMMRRYKQSDSQPVKDELARFMSSKPCKECEGSRLNRAARNVYFFDHNISSITALPIGEALSCFSEPCILNSNREVAVKIIAEIRQRLEFMVNIGLDYLTLDRSAGTLSGGEAQRIRLASQIGAGLVGVMYVLDEPSIGLHQRDNQRLLSTLFRLRDLGNTVIVVEHDEEAIRSADHVIDMGQGAGVNGGEIVAFGTPDEIMRSNESLTGQYLSGARQILRPGSREPVLDKDSVRILGAKGNNLRSVDLTIPLGVFTCITGVSGSGKSTLINDTLYAIAARELNGASIRSAEFDEFEGFENLDKVVNIDQSPIGRTPRSNPATYTGLFGPIREIFSATPEARSRGYQPGRFSFNVKGGRCESCQGDGLVKVEMHFLPDVYVECDSCKGARYNRETLDILYKGLSISDVLNMTIEEADQAFCSIPSISRKTATLMEVGLSYLKLGQSATTLSGGEAQRVKLARELSRRATGRTLYILDEPTTGLHFYDIEQLLGVLHRLKQKGNTVVVIEHNLDVVKTADWIIDLGPEGGAKGGRIVAVGTPEDIAKTNCHTGQYLKDVRS